MKAPTLAIIEDDFSLQRGICWVAVSKGVCLMLMHRIPITDGEALQ
jgi:hypothetical protein